MLSTKLKEAAGNSADATLYVNDVFSVYLYTGNGSTQTINNGIDLAGKGGMVWTKVRNYAYSHALVDTVRGNTKVLNSNTYTLDTIVSDGITGFNSTGYSLGADTYNGWFNYATTHNYASWTFRKAPKFFDIVTYTGDGTSNKAITHNLGITPGFIIVRNLSANAYWTCFHNSFSAGSEIYLNDTAAKSTDEYFPTLPTSSNFYVNATSGNGTNQIGSTYVAYLFAHDTSSTGIIQCGSFTTDGSGKATVNLGWEPQYLMMKGIVSGDWTINDSMRPWPANPNMNSSATLLPNSSSAEATGVYSHSTPTATGFLAEYAVSTTYIYMAIRMPNKPPTTGTQVYNAIARTGTSTEVNVTGVGFATDLIFAKQRTANWWEWIDRLRGADINLFSNSTSAEYSNATTSYKSLTSFALMDGVTLGADQYNGYINYSPNTYINYFFKRAPGFFDEVCYTGTGVARTVAHNLTVAPELMIVKRRSNPGNGDGGWAVYPNNPLKWLGLNSTAAMANISGSTSEWNSTAPTSSVFSLGSYGSVVDINSLNNTFVAYLFATLAGISKVGSYTGNGTGQAIACGFSAGARFVLIKRTDSTGNWYTFDSARGLTSGSSPYLLLNSSAAETTGNNGVYASTGGFTLGSTASTTTNINAATYIFLAVA